MLLFGGCWLAGGLELEEGDATRGPGGTPRSSSPGGELGSSDIAGLGAAALWAACVSDDHFFTFHYLCPFC